jgi:hypothetical protein
MNGSRPTAAVPNGHDAIGQSAVMQCDSAAMFGRRAERRTVAMQQKSLQRGQASEPTDRQICAGLKAVPRPVAHKRSNELALNELSMNS